MGPGSDGVPKDAGKVEVDDAPDGVPLGDFSFPDGNHKFVDGSSPAVPPGDFTFPDGSPAYPWDLELRPLPAARTIPRATAQNAHEENDRFPWLTLGFGMLLLPFSTGAGQGSYVFSFGLPVLGFFVALAQIELVGRLKATRRDHFLPLAIGATYVLCALLFVVPSLEPLASFARVATAFLGYLLFVTIVLSMPEPPKEALLALRRHLGILCASGVVLSIYYVATAMWAASENGLLVVFSERYVGGAVSLPWGASNTIAAALLIPAASAIVALQLPAPGRFAYISLFVILMAIIFSVSRNAISILGITSVLLAIFLRKWLPLAITLAITVAGVLLVQVTDIEVLDFLYNSRIEHYVETGPMAERTEIWNDMLEHIAENPFSPVGYYGSQSYFGGISAHNIFLTAFIEQNAPGLIAAAALLGYPFWWLVRRFRVPMSPAARRMELTLLIVMAGLVLNLQAEDAHFTQQYMVYLWYFLAVLYSTSDAARAI